MASAEADEFKTQPQTAADVASTTTGVEALSLAPPPPLDGIAASKEAQTTVRRIETHTEELKLPKSSDDAKVVSTPLAKPLEVSKPNVRPPPTADQMKKYDHLLANVSKWTELPE